jgi:hypothetical protein
MAVQKKVVTADEQIIATRLVQKIRPNSNRYPV